jgi:hypothetical protein
VAATDATGFMAVEERIRAAVERVARHDPDPANPLRGLFISDDQALALAGGSRPAEPGARLAEAITRLGLDQLEGDILALCAAPEFHPDFGRMFGYLHDDVTRRLASPRLAADLLAGPQVFPETVLAAFAPAGRLRARGAITLLEDGPTPLADRAVKLAGRLTGFLIGLPEAPAGAGLLRRHEPLGALAGRAEPVDEIARVLRAESRLPVVVAGPDAATLVAEALAAPVLVASASDATRPEVMADAVLVCALEGRRLCLDGLEDVEPSARAALRAALNRLAEPPVFVAADHRAALALGERSVLVVEVPMPTFAERDHAWSELAEITGTGEVAAKFRLSIGQIADAVEVARVTARARGAATPEPQDLDAGARHASASRLGSLANRLAPGFRWDDLVLPERQGRLLRSVSATLRHRDRVLSDWGYERVVGRTQGLKVLFAGESGTGKTMAAQVLATELGLELFQVDLATVVSKYIGETEKNLSAIFDAAEGSNAILFFDEADALFGKRSEVSDSHDRYANIEVAYLLQRMEAYEGAVILATNFRRNIDDAFIRRLDFVVDFPFPEAADRARIWQRLLPEAAPVHEDVDVGFLSARFKLSGGAIRNCSLTAAFQAADEDSAIHMRHLVRAVAQEYGKQGRLTLQADFERFHALIGPG